MSSESILKMSYQEYLRYLGDFWLMTQGHRMQNKLNALEKVEKVGHTTMQKHPITCKSIALKDIALSVKCS